MVALGARQPHVRIYIQDPAKLDAAKQTVANTKAAIDQAARILEGKDYLVKDGDLMLFRFNV